MAIEIAPTFIKQKLIPAVINTAQELIISYLCSLPDLPFHLSGKALRANFMEMTGIEPVTSDLQSRRSTN